MLFLYDEHFIEASVIYYDMLLEWLICFWCYDMILIIVGKNLMFLQKSVSVVVVIVNII